MERVDARPIATPVLELKRSVLGAGIPAGSVHATSEDSRVEQVVVLCCCCDGKRVSCWGLDPAFELYYEDVIADEQQQAAECCLDGETMAFIGGGRRHPSRMGGRRQPSALSKWHGRMGRVAALTASMVELATRAVARRPEGWQVAYFPSAQIREVRRPGFVYFGPMSSARSASVRVDRRIERSPIASGRGASRYNWVDGQGCPEPG